MHLKSTLLVLGCALAMGTPALAQKTQGVSADEIVVGTIQDLSGPIAGFGKEVRNGLILRADEINAAGGVHGRSITLKAEDSAYDPKRAVLAAQKLVNRDKIFAMLGHLGTAGNVATFPILFDKQVVNFFPVTGARQMYEDPDKHYKYAFSPTYYDQMRVLTPILAKEKGASKVCTIYQDDDFGLEVLQGVQDGLKEAGMELVEKTSYKRGATDFSSQVARMKASGCDFVAAGTLIRETIGMLGEARKIGFEPVFMGSSGAYTDLIHKLGGENMNGFYAGTFSEIPYPDSDSEAIRDWAAAYKEQFKEDPGLFSAYGYMIMDVFAKGLEAAGAELTSESFIAAMDELTVPVDLFGTPELSFSETKRLGSTAMRISQIQDGRWKVVSDYIE